MPLQCYAGPPSGSGALKRAAKTCRAGMLNEPRQAVFTKLSGKEFAALWKQCARRSLSDTGSALAQSRARVRQPS
eukprot:scaffold90054_cov75-Phaeocystis_antarctica.AAC.11